MDFSHGASRLVSNEADWDLFWGCDGVWSARAPITKDESVWVKCGVGKLVMALDIRRFVFPDSSSTRLLQGQLSAW